ncbi:hypothetical protein NXY31_23180 [Bacteroides salyersiae]|nr:hypothetical protein [Bacteroides salyersiae]
MKFQRITITFLLILAPFCVMAQKWYTSDVDEKVDNILRKMTVKEKLSYIGGIDWMYTRNIDRLGIPRMKMSDDRRGSVLMDSLLLIRLRYCWLLLGMKILPMNMVSP